MDEIQIVICTESGDGYEQGRLYPVVGLNNGVQIAREDHIGYFCTTDKFENFDCSGKPSFREYCRLSAPKW